MPPKPGGERAIRTPCYSGGDPSKSKFARELHKVGELAREYAVLDGYSAPHVKYVVDMNYADAPSLIRAALEDFKPDLIICMETLEHVNYHHEIMKTMDAYGCEVFITIPNNGNWIFNRLGWNYDHCVSFLPETGLNFVKRAFAKRDISYIPCFQQWAWYWRAIYLAGFCQPFSLGFHIKPI